MLHRSGNRLMPFKRVVLVAQRYKASVLRMDYPNLESCRVILRPERKIHQEPIRLPPDCLQQANQVVPKPLDFATGRFIHLDLLEFAVNVVY
jgi:hypothetical protein